MGSQKFRILLKGLASEAGIQTLGGFLQKELGLGQADIIQRLKHPPRKLWELPSQENAHRLQDALLKMGCMTEIVPVQSFPSLPFSIPLNHEKVIHKEMSKILRTRAVLALFLVVVQAGAADPLIPSMMAPDIEDRLAEYLRDSDTVLGIDDERLLILGFSTDRKGVQLVTQKLIQAFDGLVGQNVHLSLGVALFPEEARTLPGLLLHAENARSQPLPGKTGALDTKPVITKDQMATGEPQDQPPVLQACFTNARGRMFSRLIAMKPQMLWMGLGQLPQARQMAFLSQVPYDAPVLPYLKKLVSAQPQVKFEQAAQQHFEAVLQQMESQDDIHARQRLRGEIQAKLQHVEELPTLPTVAVKVYKLASESQASAGQLSEIIMNDPALTSKLLKTVNSAYYAGATKIVSIKDAVVRLGTEEIIDIAFGLAAARVFDFKPFRGFTDPNFLWHHSVCTGLIAQHLARKLPEAGRKGMFTAGLLHDVGKIFLIENYSDDYNRIHEAGASKGMAIFELEAEKLGIHHAAIGENISRNWNLPDELVQAAAFHHHPYLAESHHQTAALVGLADELYYRSCQAGDFGVQVPQLDHYLTFGHVMYLKKLFTDFGPQVLETLVQESLPIMEKGGELVSDLK